MTNENKLLNTIVNAIETEEYESIKARCYDLDGYGDVIDEIDYIYSNATKYSVHGIIEEIKRSFRKGAAEVELVIGSITLDIDICLEFDIIEE